MVLLDFRGIGIISDHSGSGNQSQTNLLGGKLDEISRVRQSFLFLVFFSFLDKNISCQIQIALQFILRVFLIEGKHHADAHPDETG